MERRERAIQDEDWRSQKRANRDHNQEIKQDQYTNKFHPNGRLFKGKPKRLGKKSVFYVPITFSNAEVFSRMGLLNDKAPTSYHDLNPAVVARMAYYEDGTRTVVDLPKEEKDLIRMAYPKVRR